MAQNDEIRYLTPQGSEQKKKNREKTKFLGEKFAQFKKKQYLCTLFSREYVMTR